MARRGNLGRVSPPMTCPDRVAQGERGSEGSLCSTILRPPSRPGSHHLLLHMHSHGHTEGTQTQVAGGPEVFRLSSTHCHLPHSTLLPLKSCPFVPVGGCWLICKETRVARLTVIETKKNRQALVISEVLDLRRSKQHAHFPFRVSRAGVMSQQWGLVLRSSFVREKDGGCLVFVAGQAEWSGHWHLNISQLR